MKVESWMMSLDTRNMTVTKIRITIVMAIQSRELRSDLGGIDLNIPRDRNSDFDPELVSKHHLPYNPPWL